MPDLLASPSDGSGFRMINELAPTALSDMQIPREVGSGYQKIFDMALEPTVRADADSDTGINERVGLRIIGCCDIEQGDRDR